MVKNRGKNEEKMMDKKKILSGIKKKERIKEKENGKKR